MLMSPRRRVALVLALGALGVSIPLPALAQLRTIVSKQVSASSNAAEIEIEFLDEEVLNIALDRGTVFIDGRDVGDFQAGDALDRSWRELLGEAMGLENGALSELLLSWEPPGSGGSASTAAQNIDRRLEASLTRGGPQDAYADVSVAQLIDADGSLANFLLSSVGRLGLLEEAIAELDSDFRVHVDEDVWVRPGTRIEQSLVIVGGSLRVEGRVDGDVVVVGGTLDVRPEGRIDGEARVAESRVVRSSGDVGGGIVDVLDAGSRTQNELRERLREEIREEIRAELRSDLPNEIRNAVRLQDEGFSIMTPLRPVIRGVGGMVEKLLSVFFFTLLGAGLLAFARENVETVSRTARQSPGRAAMAGFAGTFLLIPVWILGTIALLVSVVGIPVAIAWLPLFPIAAIVGGLLGFVAVAHNAGEWLADSELPFTGWIRRSNPIMTLAGGLLGLAALPIAGHALSILPFTGVFTALLFTIGGILVFVVTQIGFGAVLLTRAGRRREYAGERWESDEAWDAALDERRARDRSATETSVKDEEVG